MPLRDKIGSIVKSESFLALHKGKEKKVQEIVRNDYTNNAPPRDQSRFARFVHCP